MLNLDTHVLLYALSGELKPAEEKLLRGDSWSISAIVLWEITKLAQLDRIEIDIGSAEVRRTLTSIHTWPITLDVCAAIPDLDFRSDPADELIAATSVVHRVPLVTRDRKIRRSTLVPLAK
jgi:PIN domain nuclease of toxin-antitoxin system